MELYDEEYYKSGNYADYLQRSLRYEKLVSEIDSLLYKINFRHRDRPVLDFGCAVGFVVESLIGHGYERAVGFDISDWAVKEGNKRIGYEVLTTNANVLTRWNYLTFMLDVLEHLGMHQIIAFFEMLKSQLIIVRVPVADPETKKFVLEVSRNDASHITCLTKEEWVSLFHRLGYGVLFSLNLTSIYDSDGVLSVMLRRLS